MHHDDVWTKSGCCLKGAVGRLAVNQNDLMDRWWDVLEHPGDVGRLVLGRNDDAHVHQPRLGSRAAVHEALSILKRRCHLPAPSSRITLPTERRRTLCQVTCNSKALPTCGPP